MVRLWFFFTQWAFVVLLWWEMCPSLYRQVTVHGLITYNIHKQQTTNQTYQNKFFTRVCINSNVTLNMRKNILKFLSLIQKYEKIKLSKLIENKITKTKMKNPNKNQLIITTV